jgi:hypothetical protein
MNEFYYSHEIIINPCQDNQLTAFIYCSTDALEITDRDWEIIIHEAL